MGGDLLVEPPLGELLFYFANNTEIPPVIPAHPQPSCNAISHWFDGKKAPFRPPYMGPKMVHVTETLYLGPKLGWGLKKNCNRGEGSHTNRHAAREQRGGWWDGVFQLCKATSCQPPLTAEPVPTEVQWNERLLHGGASAVPCIYERSLTTKAWNTTVHSRKCPTSDSGILTTFLSKKNSTPQQSSKFRLFRRLRQQLSELFRYVFLH